MTPSGLAQLTSAPLRQRFMIHFVRLEEQGLRARGRLVCPSRTQPLHHIRVPEPHRERHRRDTKQASPVDIAWLQHQSADPQPGAYTNHNRSHF